MEKNQQHEAQTIVTLYPHHAVIEYGAQKVFTRIRYSEKGHPRPLSIAWEDKSHKLMTIEEISQATGLSAALVSEIGQIVLTKELAYCVADENRIEQGRKDWNRMSAEEQNALNAFVVQAEGHTID